MNPVTVCTCNPALHQPYTSTDIKLLRRVRRDCLGNARRWQSDPKATGAIVCSLYKAHLCLLRLRELRAKTEN
jgi:hypothetical protein